MKVDSKQCRTDYKKRAVRLIVPALFLCSSLIVQAADNWADGSAYGTNYSALASAASVSSQVSTNGSLIIGHTNTTSLTLNHDISGFIFLTNRVDGFSVTSTATNSSQNDAVFYAENATNLTLTGGYFIGIEGSGGGLPPIPGGSQPTNSTISARGGILFNSTVMIDGTEFAGVNHTEGLYIEGTELVVSNGTFRGGNSGIGLMARDNSTVTIHSGSFTGGVGTTAFYLQNSDATVFDGTFGGNIGGTSIIAGDGLFSELTDATTNHVNLHGGDFSSLAFFGADGSVQHFLAGTNLTLQNGIIQNGGTVMVDDQSGGALTDIWIESGTMDFGSNAFSVPDGGVLGFGIGGNTNGFLTAGTAYFQTNSAIEVNAATANFTAGTNEVTLLSTSGGIFIGNVSTNRIATSADFTEDNVTATVSGRNRLNDIFVINDRLLRFQFTTTALKEYWNADGQFGDFADELENYPEMTKIIDLIDDPELSQAITEETYFTTMNTFQIAMQGLQAAVGQSVSRGAEFRDQLKLIPPGAKGPERKNDLRGWVKYYGQFYSHDAEGLNPEYDATLHGGVGGVDKSIGNLLLGIGGGAGNYRITSGNDAEETISAYQGSLYGTYGTKRAYFDAGIAYGFNQVETQTDAPFVLNGEFDAQLVSAYFGAGYDLVDTKGGTIFTPEASVQYSLYKQDAYSETSEPGIASRNIDAFDADSLRSSLGLNVSMFNTTKFKTFGFKLDGRAHWLHEFNPEQGEVTFNLEGGGNDYQLTLPLLDEELFRVGFGFSFFNTLKQKPKNVLLRLDFDELFGDGFNSHNLSMKVIYAF